MEPSQAHQRASLLVHGAVFYHHKGLLLADRPRLARGDAQVLLATSSDKTQAVGPWRCTAQHAGVGCMQEHTGSTGVRWGGSIRPTTVATCTSASLFSRQQCALRSHPTHPLDNVGCAAAPGRRRGRPLCGRLIWLPPLLGLVPALRCAGGPQSLWRKRHHMARCNLVMTADTHQWRPMHCCIHHCGPRTELGIAVLHWSTA